MARWRRQAGRPIDCSTHDVITPADVTSTLAAQGTVVHTGDILLLHTGWLDWYRSTDADRRARLADVCHAPGLAPGTATVRTLPQWLKPDFWWLRAAQLCGIVSDQPLGTEY